MKTYCGIVILAGMTLLFGQARIAESLAQQTASTQEAGFEGIFDGKTLKSREVDPKYERIEVRLRTLPRERKPLSLFRWAIRRSLPLTSNATTGMNII